MDGQQNDALAIANQIREKKQEVRYGTREYVAEYLVGKFKTEDFYIPLEYQRNFVWSDEDCSYFIESVLIGLPIPYMFFADTEDGRTEIVDGAQRMNALVTFVNGDLTLRGLKILTAVNSKVYSELPIEVQRRFNNASFRVVYFIFSGFLTDFAEAGIPAKTEQTSIRDKIPLNILFSLFIIFSSFNKLSDLTISF